MTALLSEGYSARVDLKLHVDGQVLDVAQTGRRSLILREQHAVAGRSAELVITVDGNRSSYPIVLGAVAGREVFYTS